MNYADQRICAFGFSVLVFAVGGIGNREMMIVMVVVLVKGTDTQARGNQ
jgi:hypothetical protein